MARYTGETIKVDNAVAVFKAVAEYGCVTRSDISAHTGLSIVTAGKATEEFLDREIFIQKESQSKTIGRHASRLSLDRNKLLVLLDISNKDFVVNYYDLSLNCVFTNKHRYIDDFTYKDNLRSFLHSVKAYMIDRADKRFLMVGLIVPGSYDRETDTVKAHGHLIEQINPCKFIQQSVAMSINFTIGNMSAAVKRCQTLCAPNENCVYISVDADNSRLYARLILGGKLLRSYSEEYKIIDVDNLAGELTQFVTSICTVVNVNNIYLDYISFCAPRYALNEVAKHTKYNCTIPGAIAPKLNLCEPGDFPRRGAIETLRRIWLERIINNF